eukprot:CAMPEP_0115531636 /NCGR_PEP_ID=MMETSP0271-20121206/85154_1 /TAXON_ID=71861 /ORGANISM="Scrippsiella trochoidea, Strain CCMP3099" /LENGTH=288 /DNA_ID=CAMNT_0002963885 /DNA_START=1 /DNA_END=864 /DNA_ORIENTATION=-
MHPLLLRLIAPRCKPKRLASATDGGGPQAPQQDLADRVVHVMLLPLVERREAQDASTLQRQRATKGDAAPIGEGVAENDLGRLAFRLEDDLQGTDGRQRHRELMRQDDADEKLREHRDAVGNPRPNVLRMRGQVEFPMQVREQVQADDNDDPALRLPHDLRHRAGEEHAKHDPQVKHEVVKRVKVPGEVVETIQARPAERVHACDGNAAAEVEVHHGTGQPLRIKITAARTIMGKTASTKTLTALVEAEPLLAVNTAVLAPAARLAVSALVAGELAAAAVVLVARTLA